MAEKRRPLAFLLASFALMLLVVPVAARGNGAWLDAAEPANWNTPGAALPEATTPSIPIDPRALARERQAETAEDEALAEAGWRLFAPYQAGWGAKVIQATSSYDGMGRPWDYQAFVFVDGIFAGTLSPDPMQSRFDGALDRVQFFVDTVTAEFRRLTVSDPLCCPSGGTSVQYRIERGDTGPVVVPLSAITRWTAPPAAAPAPSPAVEQPTPAPEAGMLPAEYPSPD